MKLNRHFATALSATAFIDRAGAVPRPELVAARLDLSFDVRMWVFAPWLNHSAHENRPFGHGLGTE